MKFTPADITHFHFSADGRRVDARALFNSHEADKEGRLCSITINFVLTVQDGETVAALRLRAAEAAQGLLAVDIADLPPEPSIEEMVRKAVERT